MTQQGDYFIDMTIALNQLVEYHVEKKLKGLASDIEQAFTRIIKLEQEVKEINKKWKTQKPLK